MKSLLKTMVLLITLTLTAASAKAQQYFYMSNNHQGPNMVLTLGNDGKSIIMAKKQEGNKAQMWYLEKSSKANYSKIINAKAGNAYSLDVKNMQVKTNQILPLFLDKNKNVSGQYWVVSKNGKFSQLTTMFKGTEFLLDCDSNKNGPRVGLMPKRKQSAGQYWVFQKVGKPLQGGVEAPAGKIEILSAVWANGARSADVTKKVQELVNKGERKIWARNHILGADPAPGTQKRLTVKYKMGGKTHEKVIVERNYLEF